jgi:nucleoside-diphosphate-sugar epimerase
MMSMPTGNDLTATGPAQPIALVLGITGSFGRAIAATLARRGYRIRALRRDATAVRDFILHPVEWITGDAMDGSAVTHAAQGAALIVHGVNPPRFRKWRELAIPMLQNTIAAAIDTRATILFPANIYIFGNDTPATASEVSARLPTTRKGLVRLEMEKLLADASRSHGIRIIAVRAGDFFGPGVRNSWFTQAVAKDGRNAKSIKRLTPPGIGHGWAYVPDLAETFGRLVDIREKLAPFEMVHFTGHYDETGVMLAKAVVKEIGHPDLRIKPFPWFTVYLAAPFVPFLRETIEMMWLWKHPLRLDNTKLVRLIGPEPHTPLEQAVSAALGLRPTAFASLQTTTFL